MRSHHARRTALALVLSTAACLPLQAAEPGTPEQVADLYLKTFVNHDVAAMRALNDYLKPAYDGNAPYDPETLQAAIDAKPATDLAEAQAEAEAREIPAAEREAFVQALAQMSALMEAVVRTARCTATGHEVRPNEATRAMSEASKDDDIAAVTYRCEVAVVDGSVEAAMATSQR